MVAGRSASPSPRRGPRPSTPSGGQTAPRTRQRTRPPAPRLPCELGLHEPADGSRGALGQVEPEEASVRGHDRLPDPGARLALLRVERLIVIAQVARGTL